MIAKSGVYESLIKIQKESGQGLSGIVKAAAIDVRNHVNEWLKSQDQNQKVQSLIKN
jgi:hypothetical protein